MQQVLFSKLDETPLWFRKENCQYHIVDTKKKLERLHEIVEQADVISFDCETTGLDVGTCDLVGLSICVKEGTAFYVPIGHKDCVNIDFDTFRIYFKHLLETKAIVGHNIKFDYKFLKSKADIRLNCVDDTFIISKMLEEFDSVGLKHLGSIMYGFDIIELVDLLDEYEISYDKMHLLRPTELYEYACQDVDLTLRLFHTFYKEYNWQRTFIYEVEVDLIFTLGDMETKGVKVDYNQLLNLKTQYTQEVEELGSKMRGILKVDDRFNLESNPQFIAAFLVQYPDFQSALLKTKKSDSYKMNKDAVHIYRGRFRKYLEYNKLDAELNIFAHHIEWKKKVSLLSKYVVSWINMIEEKKSTTIYSSFNSLGAGTGRMSSNDPNLQNVTTAIRHCIVPRDGYYFLAMDFDQMEYRILAAMAGLKHLIDEINNGDSDVHSVCARLLYDIPLDEKVPKELRKVAKTLNFGILYGMGDSKLADALGVTIEEAQELKVKYNKRFLRNSKWFKAVKKFARTNGYVLTSYGRKRRIENIALTYDHLGEKEEQHEIRRLLAEANRKAINTPIQGTSADITKIALNNVHHYIINNSLDVWPVLVIHDEIVFEVSNKYDVEEMFEKLRPCMEMMYKETVKLTVDKNFSTESWGALKD